MVLAQALLLFCFESGAIKQKTFPVVLSFMNSTEFQNHAEKMFPLVSHMGLKVKTLSEKSCILTGSIAENKKGTPIFVAGVWWAFGCHARIVPSKLEVGRNVECNKKTSCIVA